MYFLTQELMVVQSGSTNKNNCAMILKNINQINNLATNFEENLVGSYIIVRNDNSFYVFGAENLNFVLNTLIFFGFEF